MNLRMFLCRLSVILLLIGTGRIALAQQLPPAGTDAAKASTAKRGSARLAAATGSRTSPFEPLEANDHSFVTDAAPNLDTSCIFRSSGPIIFNIEITRHVGELNPDGTLKNAAALVAAGLLSPKATLIMPAFDVDSEAVVSGAMPERDRVSFNGEEIGFLSGEDETWKLNYFEIPIEKVRFAQRGANGSASLAAINEVRIDIDTANSEETWCTSIDWGTLGFKAMSPIILIHGNNSDGGFFDRRGFTSVLRSQHLLFDNSIKLDTTAISVNARDLNTFIPNIVKSFGVDSVHLVAHSKGGLDSREYLALYQPQHKDFKVLSYTSLSTPHNGSAGADLLVQRKRALENTILIVPVGFSFTQIVASFLPVDAGTPDLTTGSTAVFNAENISRLPPDTIFNTVAADADLNGNAEIDRRPDEYADLRAESSTLRTLDVVSEASRRAVDLPYQLLRNTARVRLVFVRQRLPPLVGPIITVAVLINVPTSSALGNDVLVTIPSGQGAGSIAARTTNTIVFRGAAGRNHSSVANEGVAERVVPWIINIERTLGDLR